MNKREYIQDLISKGFNDDEILYKLDNEFKEPTDPPKKKQDPATAETSVGSSEDMVSSSEDGSLVSRDRTIETEIELPGMKDMPELERQFASGELTRSDLEGMGLIVSDDGKINVQSVGQVEIKVKAKEKEEDLTWLERKFGKNNATDFFGDIYRSFKSGYAQGESFDSAIELFKQGTTDEEIKKYLSDVRNLENFHGTDEMLQFEDDYSRMSEKYGPVAGFFYGAWRNPSIMHQYASQSLGNMAASVQTGEAIASAASAGAGGAGAGALVSGPGGAIVGGGAGFIGGLSGAMEVGFTTADLLKDEIDKELISSGASTRWDNMGDEQRFSYVSDILNNPVKKNELRNRALRRGIAIGTFDAVTGALTQGTGKVVTGAVKKATRSAYKASSKVAKTTTRVSAKLAPTIARGTTETTMGIASEYAGQIAAGQEIDTKDALIEGLAGDKIFTIAGMATDAIAANGKYKINGQKLGFNEFTESIKKMDDIAFTEARIDVEGDDVIKAIVDNRREDIKIDQSIDAKISDANDRADLIRLEREISQLKSSESETNKNKIANLREKVKKISDAYIDADVDVSIEDRQLAIANAARNRVENEFNDNAKKVESAARDVEGVEIKKFDTTSEVEEYLNSVGDDVDVKKAAGQQGFIIQNSKTGKQQIILNKEQALKDNAVTVASHEFLHGILFNTVNKNTSNAISLGNALLKRLNSIDINKIENSEFKNRMLQYADESKEVRMEEALTLFSDALATGDIKYNENTFTKIGDTVRRTLQRNFGVNIKFNNGRDVYNFIKDYNKSIEEGGLTQAQAKLAVEGGKGKLIQEGLYTDTETVKASAAAAAEKPKAIFMVGGPGAGKTNVGKGLKLGRRGFKVVNQDIALEAMKEEAGLPTEESEYTAEQRSTRSKLGAAAVKAAKEKFNKYVSDKNDMVIDGTGASYNATMKKVKELQDAGFEVSMVVANTPLETALERNRARKERSLPDKIVTKTYEQVQESLAKYKQDFGDKLYEINTESINYGEDLPQDFLDKVYKGIGVSERDVKYSRASVLEEINNLIPENIETKEQFLSDRSFTKVYESVMMPGGVINNYIKSKSSSPMEAELAIDSVVDRLMNFDPQAKRKDGSTIGREGFGEFIFANTAFGKRDAKKALYEESQRKAKQTSIDDSVREIADVETVEEEATVETREKPSINPLKFSGVPDKVTISDKPGEGLTFKNVSKKYAGEVGEQILGIPAKKITDASANLGSVNEARAIQQFFFRADNLDKFVSILPEYNIATPEARVEGKDIDVSKTIQGTGIGLPKRILDYFYDDFIDPSGKLTSPKGRSKGLTSQVPVRRLKPEFRGIVSKETIDKLKLDIGITPKGELNILPKNELRSSLGQLIKGMAKTYSTLAANTLVRQELKSAGATEKQLADVAAGKARVMLSKAAVQKSKNVFMQNDSFEKSSDEFAAENKVWKAILAPLNLTLPSSKDAADIESVRTFVREKLTKVLPKSFFTGGTFANAGTSAAKRGFFYVSMEEVYNDIDGMNFAPEDIEITAAVSRDSYSKLDEKINTKQFRERQDQSINGLRKIFKAFEKLINENPENAKYVAAILSSSSQSMAHFVRTSAPINFYSVENGRPLTGGGKVVVEEHTLPASLVGKYLFGAMLDGTLDESFVNIKNNYQQGLLSKVNDKKLKGFKPNGKPYNYIASTPEGWKITDNIFARYFNENVATNNGGINPSEIVMYDGETILEKYNVDSSGFATTVQLEKQKEVAFKNNIKVAYSKAKNNSELLNDLKNRDKAIANARNAKAPRKGITVFDFDDTLATSKSMVGVTMPDGTTKKIDATEFAKQGDTLSEQGAVFDFSDFSKVVNGQPGPLISKLEKAINKFGNKDVYVLTARPANSAPAIYEFLKGVGYEIPLENITGLQNSSPEAKAQWMVEKAALGYNDFYFVDDAYKNVKAVQDAMKVLDVKSKERIVYKDVFDKLDKEFNDILEAKTGIAADKMYSDAKAEVVGASKGKYKFFIPPSAEDFVGLLYTTLSRGKLGDNQMAWYKKNLIDPYARAMNNIANERMSLVADYKALKKNLKIVPKNLRKKIPNEGFTKEQAVRIYIWNQQGFEVPGLSKSDLNEMTKYVFNNPELRVFADQLIAINKGDGYIGPNEGWLAGSITTDLMAGLQITKRAKHLEQWQANVDAIFSKQNLNKLEAAYGSNYREALENMLKRMKSGKNRNFDGDSNTGRFLDWVNGSTGAIMFFNTRSALLQTISAVNFINWSDNNILKASAAFANQPQYWKDFAYLFNSDFLKERRNNLTININEADIAEMANKGGVRGAISYILQKGFLPTQFADSFAIASGGATFYRNRLKSYLKEGLSQSEAEQKAFDDFREATEESQQSSRPDRISQQQAGPLGRIVLAFANTPSQYARIIKKASMDLAAGRGDAKVNISKILYYGAVQGIIFNAIQSALFAADFEDEEEMDEKYMRMANGMADGILRGIGVGGAVASTVKGGVLKAIEESEKKRPNYEKVAFEMTKISPPISSKLSRLNQAAREVQWNKKEMSQMGWSLDNPAWLASANVISATTNIPADRVIKKINNIDAAYSQDLEMWERMALLGGWSEWELGIQDDKKKKQTGGRVEAGSRVGSGIRVGGGRRVK